MTWAATAALISEAEGLLLVVPFTMGIYRDGLRLAARYGFAIYDSFIVAAPLATNCDTFWTEDMHDGMVVDGRLTITNPFPPPPDLDAAPFPWLIAAMSTPVRNSRRWWRTS